MKNLAEKVFIGTMILIFTIIGGIGYPLYNVWTSEQAGIAELKKAEGNRKIAIQEAEAKKESAKSLAEAEIIRAKGCLLYTSCQSLLPGFVEEDSELYSETWTKWGIVLDGHAMELPMLERHINESECLLWHTSDCSDRRSPKSKQQGVNNQVKAYWRTPQSHNGCLLYTSKILLGKFFLHKNLLKM